MAATATPKAATASLVCPVCVTPVSEPSYCKPECQREDERYLDHLKRGVTAVLNEQHHARGLLLGAQQREVEFRAEIEKVDRRHAASS